MGDLKKLGLYYIAYIFLKRRWYLVPKKNITNLRRKKTLVAKKTKIKIS